MGYILKSKGYVHVGIPDATNFTDRFYRLIHPDGGGHISQFSKESFISLMANYGFGLEELKPWPDDWEWLDKHYNLEYYNVKYLTQEELQYIVNIFRKELTANKGYIYGWEFLFIKQRSVAFPEKQIVENKNVELEDNIIKMLKLKFNRFASFFK